MQSSIPKVLDKLLTDKLYKHLNKILPDQQHGFRKKRSTVSNLLEMTNFINKTLIENLKLM